MNGAAQFSNRLTASIPRRTMTMLIAQKTAKLSHRVHGWAEPIRSGKLAASVHQLPPLPRRAPTRAKIAPPPIQVWIPNQPQATPARMRAGRLAPKTPNAARAKTGYGMPYFVPPWLIRIIGIRTITFASPIDHPRSRR